MTKCMELTITSQNSKSIVFALQQIRKATSYHSPGSVHRPRRDVAAQQRGAGETTKNYCELRRKNSEVGLSGPPPVRSIRNEAQPPFLILRGLGGPGVETPFLFSFKATLKMFWRFDNYSVRFPIQLFAHRPGARFNKPHEWIRPVPRFIPRFPWHPFHRFQSNALLEF